MMKNSVQYYQDNSSEYIETSKTFEMKPFYEFTNKFLKPGVKILDIGFGSGRDMLYFQQNGYEVAGVDGCQNFVDEGKALGLKCEYAFLPDLSALKGQKFELIYSVGVVFHLDKEAREVLFENIRELLNDGGILVLSYNELDRRGDQARVFFNVTEAIIDEEVGLKKIDQTIITDFRQIDWITPAFQK